MEHHLIHNLARTGAAFAVTAVLFAAAAPAAHADGALALGKCSAWGWSTSPTTLGAKQKAMADCAQHDSANCRIVATTHEGCVAVSTDTSASCGKVFWASEATRSDAENGSLGDCKSSDGKNCAVLATKCDRTD